MLPRFKLSEDFAGFYRENGYVVLTDLFDLAEVERARADVLSLFETRFAAINGEGLAGERLLTHYYSTERQMWRQCARRMYDLLSIYGLAAKPQVAETLERIGLARPMISTRPEVRTDMPEDYQYMQPWHQDWRYGQGSFNSVTIWIPLGRAGVENGTIDVIPGSHVLGYLETKELTSPRRFLILDPRVEQMPRFPVELDMGEAVLFSQMLVHRSGVNRSGSPRLTTQMRFVDYSESAFVAKGLPSPVVSEVAPALLWERPPSGEDMRRIFGV